MSSFLSNTAASSVTQGIQKLKRTVFVNLPSTAVTALLSGFHLSELSVYLHWSETLPGGLGAENPFHRRPYTCTLIHFCSINDTFHQ